MNATPDRYCIRRLGAEEPLPYDLLLLADETIPIIDTYASVSEIYVLEGEGECLAVYVFQVLNAESAEIKNIAVAKSHQGRGLGRQLLRDATARARERGFGKLLIGTANGAIRQLYLYQQEGFEITDIKKNFFVDHYPEPIYENGILCKHMIVLEKKFR